VPVWQRVALRLWAWMCVCRAACMIACEAMRCVRIDVSVGYSPSEHLLRPGRFVERGTGRWSLTWQHSQLVEGVAAALA